MAGLDSHYRKLLSEEDNFKRLIDGLGASDPLPLLVKYNGLNSREGSELKAKLRGKLSRDRNPVIIKHVLQKDSITSYTALSKVVQFKAPHVWEELFGFAKGTHGKLTLQPLIRDSGTVIQPAAEQPTIVWLCPSAQIFDLAREEFVRDHTPLKAMIPGNIKYYELPFLDDYGLSVWLCRPPDIQSIDIYKLYQTYNKTKFFIVSDNCTTTGEDPDYRLGDICVSKTGSSLNKGQTAIIKTKTEEWKLMNDAGEWLCSDDASVVFGTVGESYTDNTDTAGFFNRFSYNFHKKSDEAIKKGARTHHLSILMATENARGKRQKDFCDCKQSNSYHVVQYSYRVICQLAETISTDKCRSGRNPSI